MASPEFEAFLQASVAQRTDAPPDIAELRMAGDVIGQMLPPPEGTEILAVDAGGVPAEWVSAPGASTDRVVYFLHGGGYCIWSPLTYRNFNRRLAEAADARVLAIDYRLAPEHPHPAAVEDTVSSYRWLLGQGVTPDRVAVVGDSAGGGLTVATLVALRDAGDPMPACAVPISPWVDVANERSVPADVLAVDSLRPSHLEVFASSYLDGADPRAPLASPIHADLSGLPPMLVLIGEREVLMDDARRLVDRAAAAGVDVTLEVAGEMIHTWQIWGGFFPEAQEAVEQIATFLRAKLG